MREAWITGTSPRRSAPSSRWRRSSSAPSRGRSGPRFALAMASHFGVGAARSFFTGRGVFRSGLDMFLVGLGVAGIGYFLGDWIVTAAVIRWGLCCQFLDAPIKFRTATHRYVATLTPAMAPDISPASHADNAAALDRAGATLPSTRHRRVPHQQPDPSARHPSPQRVHAGAARPERRDQRRVPRAPGRPAAQLDIRLSFHPDQFVVLNSERDGGGAVSPG